MTYGTEPRSADMATQDSSDATPASITREFLELLQAEDLDRALSLLV